MTTRRTQRAGSKCCPTSLLTCGSNKRAALELPVEHVSLLSYLSYSWLDGFMWQAFRHGLQAQHIWTCPEVDGAEQNADRLERLWQEEVKQKGAEGASLTRVFIRFARKRLITSVLILILALFFLLFSVGYLLLSVMRITKEDKAPLWEGLIYVLALFISDGLQNVFFICVFTITHVAGARLRSGILMMLYKKILSFSSTKEKTSGYIVNLFANDSVRVFEGISFVPMILTAPLLGIATTGYAIYLLGPWPLVGFGVLLLLFPLQMIVGKTIMKFRAACMPITDKRVDLTNEILSHIKFMKMYAWEPSMSKEVLGLRKGEKSQLEKVNMATSIMFLVSTFVVSIATVATIMAITLTGSHITTVQAFAYLTIFSSIQSKLMFSTVAVKYLSEMGIAARRFQEILTLPNKVIRPGLWTDVTQDDGRHAVELVKVTAVWPDSVRDSSQEDKGDTPNNHKSLATDDSGVEMQELHLLAKGNSDTKSSTEDFSLQSVSFALDKGEVTGIAGGVGCGKTALITAILGQMHTFAGSMAVEGRVAYVPQVPWIFNATFKDNILFGNHNDNQRYEEVIDACCLRPDLGFLPGADDTEIGESGVNLSGGQKQRISLARAVYSDRDIYLLDDPFSALDPDVADTLFQSVVQGALVGKTIILVTHEPKYLAECDKIMYMKAGAIVESGTHEDLMERGGLYAHMVSAADEDDRGTSQLAHPISMKASDSPGVRRRPTRKSSRQRTNTETSSSGQQLIGKEEQKSGAVSPSTYARYIQSAGGLCPMLIVLLFFLLAEGCRAFNFYWLAVWFADGSGNTTISLGNVSQISHSISDNPKLHFYNLVYGVSLLATVIIYLLRTVIFVKLVIKASTAMHNKLLAKILRCPMSFFHTTPLGRIINRFSKDMDEIDTSLPPMIDQTVQCIVSILLYIAMIGVVLHWFLVAVVPLMVLFFLGYALFRVGSRDVKRINNISMSPLLSHISATSQGLHSIRAYGKDKDFVIRFVELLDHNTVTMLLYNFSMRWVSLRLALITMLSITVTALLIVLLPGHVKPEWAGLAIVYAAQLSGLFQFLVRCAVDAEAHFTSAERIRNYTEEVTSEADLIMSNFRPPGKWPSEGHIRFDQYQMRYREGLPLVLNGVTCEIQPGEKIGIVGRTGSGKSSLAAALFRLVEPSGGHIEIDGIDISRMGLEDLRTKLSIIPQDPVLFSGTIRTNLDPSKRSIDMELWRALEKCHLKETINNLEAKLDAPVAPNGDNFSAGERQLLCMARVLLRRTKILVLDEATAAIDAEMDGKIQSAISEAFSGCTFLIIAHRLSTVMGSDRVIVMESGKIVEFDTPTSLLTNPESRFSRLMAVSDKASDNQSENSLELLESDVWV